MQDNKTRVVNGPRNWGAGFMPAVYQGVPLKNGSTPIANLNPQANVTSTIQRNKLNYLRKLNQKFAQDYQHNSELDARIRNYEMAYNMQAEAPEAVDLKQEPEYIKEMYGLNQKQTKNFIIRYWNGYRNWRNFSKGFKCSFDSI